MRINNYRGNTGYCGLTGQIMFLPRLAYELFASLSTASGFWFRAVRFLVCPDWKIFVGSEQKCQRSRVNPLCGFLYKRTNDIKHFTQHDLTASGCEKYLQLNPGTTLLLWAQREKFASHHFVAKHLFTGYKTRGHMLSVAFNQIWGLEQYLKRTWVYLCQNTFRTTIWKVFLVLWWDKFCILSCDAKGILYHYDWLSY